MSNVFVIQSVRKMNGATEGKGGAEDSDGSEYEKLKKSNKAESYRERSDFGSTRPRLVPQSEILSQSQSRVATQHLSRCIECSNGEVITKEVDKNIENEFDRLMKKSRLDGNDIAQNTWKEGSLWVVSMKGIDLNTFLNAEMLKMSAAFCNMYIKNRSQSDTISYGCASDDKRASIKNRKCSFCVVFKRKGVNSMEATLKVFRGEHSCVNTLNNVEIIRERNQSMKVIAQTRNEILENLATVKANGARRGISVKCFAESVTNSNPHLNLQQRQVQR